ncbi:aminotransferase class V-fold PLP-dependent enzyme [Methylobacterium oryzihabitans]|uniref:Serine--glyoxylate aminotransferase n=1 Tax=Methylobacterium oryzihabitans TaxID=2499852 RepID=A0A437PHH2_9HYPH|nr:aminotransferase class V-fold PLP-dependent enzyme [Methylobacterium oryzihabitans]RVU21667.1 aminotransferase class V-fold PLP-dependent enzyme [Methylobacterium oryzihabitans]
MAAPWAGSRRPGRNFLFVPGPTNVPDRVQRAMVVPMEDHRSSSFPELTLPLFEDLKKVFKSRDGQVFIFPSSGTGAWEAALTNTLSPGDKVLASRFGQFSTLWIDLAQRVGLDVEVQDEEWGRGADPDRIEEALRADREHRIKAVLVVHNETATGVTSDVGAVRRAIDAAGHPAMLYVDGVSSIGSIDFRASEWGVDCAITGSQKGLMLPAGLGIVCVSPRALAAAKTAECRRCYFDFADQAKANATGYFPYTPALPLLYGLRESMRCLFEEGLEQVFARHRFLADGTRAAVKAWGLTLCAQDPKWNSDTVSAIMVPEGINGAEVIDIAYRRYNMALGAGLSKVAGKLFRIGHLGDLNELMLLGALAGAEMAMCDAGIQVQPGSGVAAAQTHFRGATQTAEQRAAA